MLFVFTTIAFAISIVINFFWKKWRNERFFSLDVGSEESWFGQHSKSEDDRDSDIRPFTVHVPEDVLMDLQHRLSIARIPRSLPNANFEYGFNSDYLQQVVNYWKTQYDWRHQEKLINKYPQFVTKIEGLDVHFMHVKPSTMEGSTRRVFPLLILHGWPGSFVEFYKLVPLLIAEREDQDFVFEVVCPSIPGFGFSESPHQKGFTMRAAGRFFTTLMKRLGHSKFYVQGGDWGAIIAMNMAKFYPNNVLGVHVNYFTFDLNFSLAMKYALVSVWPSLVSPQEYKGMFSIREKIANMIEETGYFHIQSTRPDTLAYALNDSPVGLAAYILEKFALWTERTHKCLPDGGLTQKFTLDELLTNVMVYWVNRNISSTHRFYKETLYDDHFSYYSRIPIKVPFGITNCLNELPAPRFFISKGLVRNLVMHSSHNKGGHFLALEEPRLLADDIWKFVRLVRDKEISQLIQKKLKRK